MSNMTTDIVIDSQWIEIAVVSVISMLISLWIGPEPGKSKEDDERESYYAPHPDAALNHQLVLHFGPLKTQFEAISARYGPEMKDITDRCMDEIVELLRAKPHLGHW